MSDGLLPAQNMGVGVSHKAPMLGDQTHPCVRLASMPGSHPLPHNGFGHVDPAGTCEDDEEDVPPNQEGVSPFLHLIGQVRVYLHLASPEGPSSSQLMGVERAQGSVLSCHPSLTLTVTYGSSCL
ncbi:hypothetical protein E2C01_065367 [Portunus trituberculatus]|uniref:Uncharacterized protein n=1 Tax=Portunus trituberculatus TaxID=210409 RepID=A0A5B7HQX0_PORTR|nr:hypothetical protein [Portunus trituberculatus]